MSFSDILTPRPEVLKSDGIDSVIDIENLRGKKQKAVEARPSDFFELTYPTSDIRLTIEYLDRRFSGKEPGAGTFLIEGYKGSGKSHLELLVYHLIQNPDSAKGWLAKHGLNLALSPRPVTVIRKFTDFPIDTLWNWIFDELGIKKNLDLPPDINVFREALGDRQLILILDELERGIKSIPNEANREQNLSFLQMLSEEAQRTDSASVTFFAAVYDSIQEPGSTLKRVNPVSIKFAEPRDRKRIIQHRLFTDFHGRPRQKIDQVIQSYCNEWKRHSIDVDERYMDAMKDAFPFSPELSDMVLYRVPVKGGFQANRGALGLLGSLVRLTNKKADLITTAHLSVNEPIIRNKLADLDPATNYLDCAMSDLSDLKELPLSHEIISSVLMATLAPAGHISGISEMELKRQVIKPGDDINLYSSTLHALEKLGTYFQRQEDHYYFDTHEKPNAKVEYRSLRIDKSQAIEYALNKWRVELFKDSAAIIIRDSVQVQDELSLTDSRGIRFVLAPHRLSEQERRKVFHGQQNQNLIVLLEPRSETFNVLVHPDIIKWSQRAIAAQELIPTAETERRKHYEKILAEDTKWITDTIRRAGLILVWMQESGDAEEENLGNAATRDDVLRQLRETIFPRQLIEEHVRNHLSEFFGRTVRELDNIYRKTLGYPIRTADSTIPDVIRELCKAGVIGLVHERTKACGSPIDLSSMELADARITEPFEGEAPATFFPQGQTTSKAGTTPTDIIDTNSTVETHSSYSFVTIKSPFSPSINSLRQEMALRLEDYHDAHIEKVVFYILMKHAEIELSALTSAVRGSLSGSGSITADITISKTGLYSKAQVEQMIEQLPVLDGAQYSAELKARIAEEMPVGE